MDHPARCQGGEWKGLERRSGEGAGLTSGSDSCPPPRSGSPHGDCDLSMGVTINGRRSRLGFPSNHDVRRGRPLAVSRCGGGCAAGVRAGARWRETRPR